jgi:hypothetical protein
MMMEGSMIERFTLFGPADPLGHVFVTEEHGDAHAAHGGWASDQATHEEDTELCPRRAKSIVLALRTNVSGTL